MHKERMPKRNLQFVSDSIAPTLCPARRSTLHPSLLSLRLGNCDSLRLAGSSRKSLQALAGGETSAIVLRNGTGAVGGSGRQRHASLGDRLWLRFFCSSRLSYFRCQIETYNVQLPYAFSAQPLEDKLEKRRRT